MEFLTNFGAVRFRRKLVCVNTVDGYKNVFAAHMIVIHQILLDVLTDRNDFLSPICQIFQPHPCVEYPVCRGDKCKIQFLFQHAADKAGDSGMRMDNVRFFLADDLFQQHVRFHHLHYIALIHGHFVVTDPRFRQFLFIHTAVGCNDDVIALFFQFFGKFHYMSFRSADIQSHQRHQYFIFHIRPTCQISIEVTFILGCAYFV